MANSVTRHPRDFVFRHSRDFIGEHNHSQVTAAVRVDFVSERDMMSQ
jgi:hypothetical protein